MGLGGAQARPERAGVAAARRSALRSARRSRFGREKERRREQTHRRGDADGRAHRGGGGCARGGTRRHTKTWKRGETTRGEPKVVAGGRWGDRGCRGRARHGSAARAVLVHGWRRCYNGRRRGDGRVGWGGERESTAFVIRARGTTGCGGTGGVGWAVAVGCWLKRWGVGGRLWHTGGGRCWRAKRAGGAGGSDPRQREEGGRE